MNRENYRNEILYVLFAQKKIIGTVTLSVICCCLLLYLFLPRKYEARGMILLRAKTVQSDASADPKNRDKVVPLKKEDIYSEQQLLHSGELMLRVLQRTGDGTDHDDYELQTRAFALMSRISAVVIPGTNLIDVRLTGPDPQTTASLLDTIMEEYLRYRTNVFHPSGTLNFLDKRISAIGEQLRKKEHMLIEIMNQTKSSDPGREIESILATKHDLENERHRLNSDLLELRALTKKLDAQKSVTPQLLEPLHDPALTALIGRQAQLGIEMNRLLRTYQPGSQAIRILEEEQKATAKALQAQVSRYRNMLQERQATLLEKIKQIDARIEDLNQQGLELRKQQVAQDRIRQEIRQLEESARNIDRSREEAQLKHAATAGELTSLVSIAQKAQPSPTPVFPSPLLVYMGLIGGPLVGVSLGFIIEFLDHRFKRTADVERVTGLPVLFSLPEK